MGDRGARQRLGFSVVQPRVTGVTHIGQRGGGPDGLNPARCDPSGDRFAHLGPAARLERSRAGGTRKSSGPGRCCPEPPSEPEGAVRDRTL
jgi:hypothetical protein